MNTPPLIAVMPVYNESASIESVLAEWMECLGRVAGDFRLITLNDGSRDNTAEVLARLAAQYGPRLQVVDKPNSGHGRTCRAGYELALEQGAEWVFQLDSDGQCDPRFFPDFWAAREQFDCLYGKRTARDDGFGRVLVSTACRVLLWAWTGAYVRDPNVPYRLLRAGALRAGLARVPADFDIQNVALSLALTRVPGLRWKFIPIHFRARRAGENSINYQKIAKMGLNMLRELKRVS